MVRMVEAEQVRMVKVAQVRMVKAAQVRMVEVAQVRMVKVEQVRKVDAIDGCDRRVYLTPVNSFCFQHYVTHEPRCHGD